MNYLLSRIHLALFIIQINFNKIHCCGFLDSVVIDSEPRLSFHLNIQSFSIDDLDIQSITLENTGLIDFAKYEIGDLDVVQSDRIKTEISIFEIEVSVRSGSVEVRSRIETGIFGFEDMGIAMDIQSELYGTRPFGVR